MHWRTTAAILAAAVVATPVPAYAAGPAVSCRYEFTAWPGGFTADLSITNHGPDIVGWTARWTFDVPTSNISAWQTVLTVTDAREAIATNAVYNARIASGQTLRFGWNATAASTSAPTDITVNGAAC